MEVNGRTIPLHRGYGDAAPGRLLARVGALGLLELAVIGGSAAAVLEIAVGDEISLVTP